MSPPHLRPVDRRARHGPHRHLREARDTDQQAPAGTTCPRTSRTPSSAWASRRPSAATSPAWARSTTRSSCTTPCRSHGLEAGHRLLGYRGGAAGAHAGRAPIREQFMTLIPPTDHKFAAAARRGVVGRLVRLRAGRRASSTIPLQSYFRLNATRRGPVRAHAHHRRGRRESCTSSRAAPRRSTTWRTCTRAPSSSSWGKRAHLRYSTIENWSKNMYNLNTKRARVRGRVARSSGSRARSAATWATSTPCACSTAASAASSFTGITFAGAGQNLDTGCKVVLNAPQTRGAAVETKGDLQGRRRLRPSAARAWWRRTNAEGSRARRVSCASRSCSTTAVPLRHDPGDGRASAKNVDIGHEATIGRIGDDKVFYLMSRGIPEEEARAMIVNGFANPVAKELPLEYAVEMNNT